MMPSVLVVILNWRTPMLTLAAAAAALREMAGIPGAITIVDNDSGDGSEAILREGVAARGWDRVRVLQSGHNGGFGAGNNAGIRAGLPDGTRPDLVLVLNSDATPDPGAISALVTYMQTHPEAAFAGSYIHGPDGEPHLTTFRFPSVASEFEGAARLGVISRLLRNRAVPVPIPDHSTRIDWLAGASLMMRMDDLDRIGLFDEGYFLYFEETDLCLRLARAGRQVHFVRDSSVTHIGSASTGMKTWARVPEYWFDSRWRYFAKNHGTLTAVMATVAHVKGGLIHRLRARLSGRPPADPPQFLGMLLRHAVRAVRRPLPRQTAPAPAE